MKNKFYSLEKKSETEANIYIYGDIVTYKWDETDVTADDLRKELEDLGDIQIVNVHINSYGGSTFQGLAIYNLLKQHKAFINVFVDGIAASSASIIAMAGDKIFIPRTALMMIHNCWTFAIGNAEELRKTAEDMDKIAEAYKAAYMSKINISQDKLEELLADETYLTADECVEMGFADEILEDNEQTAVNSYANKSILNLVNRLKNAEKEKQEQTLEVESLKENKLSEKLDNIQSKLDILLQKETKNEYELKQDSWKSFFNTKNKKG